VTTIDDIRAWFHDLSLAGKCLLVFGAASTLIIVIALSLPLVRMNGLVGSGERELARSVYATWLLKGKPGSGERVEAGRTTITPLELDEARDAGADDPFVRRALARFDASRARTEYFDPDWSGWNRVYRYARPVRDGAGALTGLVVLEHRSEGAGWLLVVNMLYVIGAGGVVLSVALVVYAAITSKLILRPVLSLQKTAELVRDGNLETRSDIDTGDEFEELAGTINLMLAELQRQQEQLRGANAAMDLKLSELTEANTALYESARLKGEFLASVSHELRTPLNAIIGFAELLLEIVRKEMARAAESGPDAPGAERDALAKRERYLVNIVSAGRTLLEMIESLLEMAKIEAGRVELDIGVMNTAETCQALVGLVHPLARKNDITVRVEIDDELPVVETDAKKFQQIVFNLLSNAVKFTGRSPSGSRGEIVLRAERLGGAHADPGAAASLRVSVIDNGPGIAPEDQKRIFDKFQQADALHTRSHQGTGLGLAIVSELTRLLQGEIQLESEPGAGSMFSVIIPTRIDRDRLEEAKLEARFRASMRPGAARVQAEAERPHAPPSADEPEPVPGPAQGPGYTADS